MAFRTPTKILTENVSPYFLFLSVSFCGLIIPSSTATFAEIKMEVMFLSRALGKVEGDLPCNLSWKLRMPLGCEVGLAECPYLKFLSSEVLWVSGCFLKFVTFT